MVTGSEYLDHALRDQIFHRVTKALNQLPSEERLRGARVVMRFLRGGDDQSETRLCIDFAARITSVMIGFVCELVRDYAGAISNDRPPIGSTTQQIHLNLEECDGYLRDLRALQNDFSMLAAINSNEAPSGVPLTRLMSSTASTFQATYSPQTVVEKCLLSQLQCEGMKWLVRYSVDLPPAGVMTAYSTLVAYLFISSSSSLDSFFVGLHILRTSGQHVQTVLESLYYHTSVRYVRDRILAHLQHFGFQPWSHLKRIEQLYPNNCYETELNRGWTDNLSRSSNSSYMRDGKPFQAVECGNIADFMTAQVDTSNTGHIGTVSLEESRSILRCPLCVDSSKPNSLRDHSIDSTKSVSGRGYLHAPVEWLRTMSEEEISNIVIEGEVIRSTNFDGQDQPIDKQVFLEYLIRHKDWKSSSLVIQTSDQSSTLLFSPNGPTTFLSSVVEEAKLSASPASALTQDQLACINRLLSGSSVLSFEFHISVLHFLVCEKGLFQVAQLYLRKYALGETYGDAIRIANSIPSDQFKQILIGRLGNPYLAEAADITSDSDDDSPDALVVMSACVMRGSPLTPEELQLIDDFAPPIEVVRAIEAESVADILQLETYRRDVSMCTLLEDVFGDSVELVKPSLPESALRDELEPDTSSGHIEYLISQGRPGLAYYTTTMQCDSSQASPLRSVELQMIARRVAFYNLFLDGVVASAVSFLDLFSESTETLRVDVQSARTILSSPGSASTGEVVQLFLSFGSSRDQLLVALKLLEESAWAKEPPVTEAPGVTSGFESPWHLVALFCRVHNLPRSLTLLHELARNGDWVMFLHESDLQQCPLETVKDVIRLYFEKTPLRRHLEILLHVNRDVLETPRGGVAEDVSGLGFVLRNDCGGWKSWVEQKAASSVVKERASRLFPNDTNGQSWYAMFLRSLKLFQFDSAKRIWTRDGNREGSAAVVARILHEVDYSSPLFAQEVQGIVSPEKPSIAPAKGEAVISSLRVENVPPSPKLSKIDDIRTEADIVGLLTTGDYLSHRGWISCPDSVNVFGRVLVETRVENMKVFAYDDLVACVDSALVESLGDQLDGILTGDNSDRLGMSHRRHVELVVFHAYTAGFVEEGKLDAFVNRVGNAEINKILWKDEDAWDSLDCRKSSAELTESFPKILQSDTASPYAIRTVIDRVNKYSSDEFKVDELFELSRKIACAEAYARCGFVQEHLRACEEARFVIERIKTTAIF